MKPSIQRYLLTFGSTLLALGLLGKQATAQDATVLHDNKERLSYALGMDLGQQLHRLAVEVEPALFARGLQDGISGGKTLMSREEAQASIASLQDEMQRREKAKAMLQQPQSGQPSESSEAAQQ